MKYKDVLKSSQHFSIFFLQSTLAFEALTLSHFTPLLLSRVQMQVLKSQVESAMEKVICAQAKM